jgi:hypothetical protein
MIQQAEHRAQSSEHRAQGAGLRVQGAAISDQRSAISDQKNKSPARMNRAFRRFRVGCGSRPSSCNHRGRRVHRKGDAIRQRRLFVSREEGARIWRRGLAAGIFRGARRRAGELRSASGIYCTEPRAGGAGATGRIVSTVFRDAAGEKGRRGSSPLKKAR